jgi:4-hydroxybenzoate polyprenyltransferase
MVVKFGIPASLQLAQLMHVVLLLSLVGFGIVSGLGPFYYAALVLVIGALIYEHQVAAKAGIARINEAFFQANAFVSVVFVAAITLGLWVR